MTIYTPIVEHALIPNPRMMTICRMFQDMNEKVLKECHSPNIMLFNCRIVVIYSLLFFMQSDYVKNTVSTLGFVLNSIVFNEYEQINQCYELNVTMNFKMQLEQGMISMQRDGC